MTLDLTAIRARIARGYVYDRPGEIVQPETPEDDALALCDEVERLKGLVAHASLTHFPRECDMCDAILALRQRRIL